MQFFKFQTSVGLIAMAAEPGRLRTLMIHGLMRSPSPLLAWGQRLPEVGFLYLPGHAGAPVLSETSLEVWAQGFREALAQLPRPMLLIGESLGAVLAMDLPYRALIAVEPLLSTDQLWPLRRTLAQARRDGVEIDPALDRLFDRPFHGRLERIAAPTLVLAGDEPLLPVRPGPEPSLLSDADFAAYADHPRVQALRIPGGHAQLDRNPEGVMTAARGFMVEHGYLDGRDGPSPPPCAPESDLA